MHSFSKNLLITLEWPPHYGGVGRMYFNLATAMPEKFCVWAPEGSDTTGNLEIINLPQLSTSGWPRWRALFFNLRNLLVRKPYDKIIVGQVFPIGLPVYLLSLWFGYKYDVFVHGLDVLRPMESWRRRWFLKAILNRANRVLAANKNIGKIVSNFATKATVQVIYPGPFITPDKFPASRAAARLALGLDERPVILSVGRLVQRKGHRDVIEALPAVVKQYPNCNYVIIGQGPELEQISQMANAHGLAESVKMLGATTDDETAKWYAAADVFVLTPFATTNDIEGLGVVYLEAASFGCAIVASRSGGITEFVSDGDNGLLVTERSSQEITAALLRLLGDLELRVRLGEEGRRKVKLFSAEEQAAKIFI
jgi:phosphatidyl-myo-inositol dimannoside synthase